MNAAVFLCETLNRKNFKKDEKSRKKVLTKRNGSDSISKRSTVRHKTKPNESREKTWVEKT